jgi:predicted Zn-dependent peptidase
LPEHRLTELDSGLRIVTEVMPSVRSAALGFFVGAGSRGETEAEAGLSHFLEHMLFRGTPRYGSTEIDQLFDGMGAELNAGTDKEGTTVYARMLDQHLPVAFDVMADMVWRPAFNDVDPERQVVLEEIAMYEDDPQDIVFDVLGRAVYGEHPLGRPIIGRAPVIRDTPVEEIAAFHARRYRPGSIVIAAAGSVDHDQIVELATSTLELRDVDPAPPLLPAPDAPRSTLQFQRKERGLAYSVYSFTAQFIDTGEIGLYVGTRPDNLRAAMEIVASELDRLRSEGVTEAELKRARENVKARIVLGLESAGARMSRLGASVLYGLPLLEIDEIMARIDAVSLEDLRALVEELWVPQALSAAGIGPDEAAFTEAVAPVCPAAEPLAA